MELQPAGTERLKEEADKAEEKKRGMKKTHEGQDDWPCKKLVDHRSLCKIRQYRY